MNSNKIWFRIVIYIMLGALLLSTVLFTVGLFFNPS